jgi:hypothetical protein
MDFSGVFVSHFKPVIVNIKTKPTFLATKNLYTCFSAFSPVHKKHTQELKLTTDKPHDYRQLKSLFHAAMKV